MFILVAIMVPTVQTIFAQQARRRVLRIKVIGKQWWWSTSTPTAVLWVMAARPRSGRLPRHGLDRRYPLWAEADRKRTSTRGSAPSCSSRRISRGLLGAMRRVLR